MLIWNLSEPVKIDWNWSNQMVLDWFHTEPEGSRQRVKTGLNFEQMVPAIKPPNWSKPAGSSPFQLLLLTLNYTAIRIMM